MKFFPLLLNPSLSLRAIGLPPWHLRTRQTPWSVFQDGPLGAPALPAPLAAAREKTSNPKGKSRRLKGVGSRPPKFFSHRDQCLSASTFPLSLSPSSLSLDSLCLPSSPLYLKFFPPPPFLPF